MSNQPTIIGVDVGKKGAVVVYDGEYHQEIVSFSDSLLDIYEYFRKLVFDLDEFVFVIGEAFGHRQVVKKHSKFYGVIELVAEEREMPVVYFTDRTCRKEILGAGNGNKKEMVHEKYKGLTPDCSDAMLFIDTYLNQCKQSS